MNTRPILIMAGGTGGHVFPALAVANALRERSCEVIWLGTRGGLEARVIPTTGIPIEWISVSGLRGKGVLTWVLAPFSLLIALMQSLLIVWRRRPAMVLGLGGFVSGPGGLAAWLLRKPLVIHEQNSVAGMTNRMLSRFAHNVLEAFPESFPGNAAADKTQQVGNPVRDDIVAVDPPEMRFANRVGQLRLLVLGGSQGALQLNKTVAQAIARLDTAQRPQILHQSGERTLQVAQDAYRNAAVEARVEAFIDNMAEAYSWADLVIGRAGALTVFELAAVGAASVLVPFPFAVDDHQTRNAAYLVDAGAAVLIQESELSEQALAAVLEELLTSRHHLLDMARRARDLAMPNAVESVVQACFAAAGNGALRHA